MAPLLVRALAGTAMGDVTLCDALVPRAGDVVHVYGRDETIAAIASESPAGVRIVGHGPGFGVALVDATSDVAGVAERLSWDVVAFDQRGCLSPRVALFRGSLGEAEAFAERLDAELAEREREVPLGGLSADERSERALYRDTASALGRCFVRATSTVGLDLTPRALVLPPPAITCVGHESENALAPSVLAFVRGARSLPIGAMQCPPLDGPVDLRVML